MILIAESGSTKTDWVLLDKKEVVKRQQTSGINPFHQNITSIIKNIASLNEFDNVKHVFFYGAGCATNETKEKVKGALLKVFPDSACEINSDVLAAARSLCGTQKGIACILGTGSNSCLYNGSEIEYNVRPLGYILGDEGSGAVMGKKFIADLLKGLTPEEIKSAFYEKYDLKYSEIIHKIYTEESPSKFLAQFTTFLSEHINNKYITNLVLISFIEFFERNIKQYENHAKLPIHFIGSIAYHFKNELEQAAKNVKLTIGKVEISPLEGLISFHTEK